MTFIPIENLGGGSVDKNFYLVKSGVCNYTVKNYYSNNGGGFTISNNPSSGVCTLAVKRSGDVNYGKLEYSIDTSSYSSLHVVARKSSADTSSSTRIGVDATESTNVGNWNPQYRLDNTFTEYTLNFGSNQTNILFYSGLDNIEIKDMWLVPKGK